jgi:hypothetical protein
MAYGLILVAGVLRLDLIRETPWGLEEKGVDRGCSGLIIVLVWLVGLAAALGATRALSRRKDLSWPATIGLSMLLWIAGLAVSGTLALECFQHRPS